MTTLIEIDDQLEVDSPMAPEHFSIAVSHMRLADENLIEACRRVLVDEQKNNEVEAAFGLRQNHLSRTCKNITRKWKEVCAQKGLVNREFALPPHEVDLVIALEKHSIESLKKRKKTSKKTSGK